MENIMQSHAKYTACVLIARDNTKPIDRATFLRLPYIWSLPYSARDFITFTYDVDVALQHRFAFATCDKTLAAFESRGLKLRSHKCSYDSILGASVAHPYGCIVSCLPTRQDMNVYGRTMRIMNRRVWDRVLRPNTYAPVIRMEHTIIRKGLQNFYADELCSSNPLFITIDLETTKEILIADPITSGITSRHDLISDIADGTAEYVKKFGAVITLAGYTFVYADSTQPSGLRYETYTQNFSSIDDYKLLTRICATPYPKIMHNGKYDMHYFTRWRIPVVNYVFDTLYYLKSVTHGFRKKVRGKGAKGFYTLQSASNFYCFESTYWKDGRQATGDEYHTYCATDCHRTAQIATQQLRMASSYAINNFLLSFWRLPVCVVMGMRGLRILEEEKANKKAQFLNELDEYQKQVIYLYGCNANQSKVLLRYFQALGELSKASGLRGAKSIDKTGKEVIRDLGELHPLFHRCVKPVKEARNRKLWLSSFILKNGFNRDDFNGGYGLDGDFFMYDLDPFGTASRRLSSSKSAFWIGGNGQQIPATLRSMYGTIPGYKLAASDGSAAETRTTAYLSKCIAMRDAVEGDQDFHSANAAFFFGIRYEDIYDDKLRKTINKVVRDLGKKINHAANYMMGARVFVDQAGATVCYKMKELLSLPDDWSLLQVAAYMLDKFDQRFPEVRNQWATEQAYEVATTGCLQCVTGYKPLILDSPFHNKSCLNECVATESQHFAAQINLNVTHELWLAEIRTGGLVLPLMQIHDENLFAVRDNLTQPSTDKEGRAILVGTEELNDIYQDCADREYDMKFIWSDGVPAKLKIPADDPVVGRNWLDVKS